MVTLTTSSLIPSLAKGNAQNENGWLGTAESCATHEIITERSSGRKKRMTIIEPLLKHSGTKNRMGSRAHEN